jgi:hypothetical protein
MITILSEALDQELSLIGLALDLLGIDCQSRDYRQNSQRDQAKGTPKSCNHD